VHFRYLEARLQLLLLVLVLLLLLEHDVIIQQTGKNSQFLTSFPSCPRPLPLAPSCLFCSLQIAPSFVALTQGLEQRTGDALHCAHAARPRGRIKTLGIGKLRFTVPNE
jgi:hypothetical protein